jgi:hypothetical protein
MELRKTLANKLCRVLKKVHSTLITAAINSKASMFYKRVIFHVRLRLHNTVDDSSSTRPTAKNAIKSRCAGVCG